MLGGSYSSLIRVCVCVCVSLITSGRGRQFDSHIHTLLMSRCDETAVDASAICISITFSSQTQTFTLIMTKESKLSPRASETSLALINSRRVQLTCKCGDCGWHFSRVTRSVCTLDSSDLSLKDVWISEGFSVVTGWNLCSWWTEWSKTDKLFLLPLENESQLVWSCCLIPRLFLAHTLSLSLFVVRFRFDRVSH